MGKILKQNSTPKGWFRGCELIYDVKLLNRKGIYLYSCIKIWKCFNVAPKKLKLQDFRNYLTGDNISEEEFEIFKYVCKKKLIKNLGKYHYLCLKCDVLLLTVVFENFR